MYIRKYRFQIVGGLDLLWEQEHGITLNAWNHFLLMDEVDERFYRMWRYFLLSISGSFRARRNQLWQIVLSKKGVEGGYVSIR